MIPGVQDDMEGCPANDVNLLYMTLSSLIGLTMFLVYHMVKKLALHDPQPQLPSKRSELKDDEFRELQLELYGEKHLKNSLPGTSHSERNWTMRKQAASPTAVAITSQASSEKFAAVNQVIDGEMFV
jgi:hypothetical protein